MPQIRIKYFTDAIERLTYIDGKSDWIDLRVFTSFYYIFLTISRI